MFVSRSARILSFMLGLLMISCSSEPSLKNFPDNEKDFAHEILAAIQTSDVQRLYAIQVPPEISAYYGFYDYVRYDEMLTLIKTPEDFIQISLQRAEEQKPDRLLKIKSFFERMHQAYDWQDAGVADCRPGDPDYRG